MRGCLTLLAPPGEVRPNHGGLALPLSELPDERGDGVLGTRLPDRDADPPAPC